MIYTKKDIIAIDLVDPLHQNLSIRSLASNSHLIPRHQILVLPFSTYVAPSLWVELRFGIVRVCTERTWQGFRR